MIGLTNPYVIGGIALIWAGSLFASYHHGKFVRQAEYTDAELDKANWRLEQVGKQNQKADQAGKEHEAAKTIIHNTTREIYRSVPVGRDSVVPVWFVRLLDRSASRDIAADPYPGKSADDPSDVTLSEASRLLTGPGGWVDLYYTCRQQVSDTGQLKPVLPAPIEEKRGFLHRLNPFE